MSSELEIKSYLIDEYYRLSDIRKVAKKNDDEEVVALVTKQMQRIKLKLQPLELPDD